MDLGSSRAMAGRVAGGWRRLLAVLLLAGALGASAQPAGVRASGITEAQAAATLSVLQRAMLYNDRDAVARLIAFPLRVNLAGGAEQVEDAAAFVRDYSRFVTPTLRRAVLAQRPAALVHSARGAQIGRGEVWLAGQCVPPGCNSTVVRIVALNPAAEAVAAAAEPAPATTPAPAPAPPPLPAPAPLPVPTSPPVAVPEPPAVSAPASPPLPAQAPARPEPPAPEAGPASAPAISARAAETQAAFVNRVWQVRRSNAVAPGTLYSFLSEGTLVIASPNGTPALGRWRVDGERLTMIETGRPYPVHILALRRDLFSIRVRGPGEPVDIELEPAAR